MLPNQFYDSAKNFQENALDLFRFQSKKNLVYKRFLKNLNSDPEKVNDICEIPFLPVEFFKSDRVFIPQTHRIVFTSSATTGNQPSRHFVNNIGIYQNSFLNGFELFYGPVQKLCILALLPGYLEREGSSLVFMVKTFIEKSNYKQSGFYLNQFDDLNKTLRKNEKDNIPTLLIGVTFWLLDFAEQYSFNLHNTIIMETGGMKGRRKEMIREEVHDILKSSFGVQEIHSEYGMTELLSQAYSKKMGLYTTPPWMKVLPYDITNPLHCRDSGKGGINIIDLANVESCAFLQTKDIGQVNSDGTFTIEGRVDESEIRGCNLMVM